MFKTHQNKPKTCNFAIASREEVITSTKPRRVSLCSILFCSQEQITKAAPEANTNHFSFTIFNSDHFNM